MIRYSMRCSEGHRFEGWFRDSDTFERLKSDGQIACTDCGTTAVEKDVMAPALSRGRASSADRSDAAAKAKPDAKPTPDLAAFRAKLEAMSDNVGSDFAAEARRIHAGEAPERPILGEATAAEAKALVKDDIPVMPLPWWNRRDD
ncbi:MAG: DUF1178 family protein [Pseudomonadota bacterium]